MDEFHISAYVPCYNNAATVLAAVESIQQQTIPIEEIFVIDDDSSDRSVAILEAAGVRVIHMNGNLGRGAVRARAMKVARNEFVLCCDATNTLSKSFAETALSWLKDLKVAAAFGQIGQKPGGDTVTRWRGRHLFRIPKVGTPQIAVNRQGSLFTAGAMVRRSIVLDVGNFNPHLRHTEDGDLGQRLLARGWDVVKDPTLEVVSGSHNSLFQVLERYWRWNAGIEEGVSLVGYLRSIWFSIKVMIPADLGDHDVPAALISFLAPHFQFWRSLLRKIFNKFKTQSDVPTLSGNRDRVSTK